MNLYKFYYHLVVLTSNQDPLSHYQFLFIFSSTGGQTRGALHGSSHPSMETTPTCNFTTTHTTVAGSTDARNVSTVKPVSCLLSCLPIPRCLLLCQKLNRVLFTFNEIKLSVMNIWNRHSLVLFWLKMNAT